MNDCQTLIDVAPEILVIGALNLRDDPREDADGQRDCWAH